MFCTILKKKRISLNLRSIVFKSILCNSFLHKIMNHWTLCKKKKTCWRNFNKFHNSGNINTNIYLRFKISIYTYWRVFKYLWLQSGSQVASLRFIWFGLPYVIMHWNKFEFFVRIIDNEDDSRDRLPKLPCWHFFHFMQGESILLLLFLKIVQFNCIQLSGIIFIRLITPIKAYQTFGDCLSDRLTIIFKLLIFFQWLTCQKCDSPVSIEWKEV